MNNKNQGKNQLEIIKFFLPLLFSRKNGHCFRYCIAGFFVISTIALNVLIPVVAKHLVNTITNKNAVYAFAVIFIFPSYGLIWTLARIVSQCRQVLMFRVFQRCTRLLGLRLFEHLNALSMNYHKNSRTGAITNSIDRAQEAIPTVFWALFFVVIPTIVEILVAAIILWSLYGFFYGAMVVAILVTFSCFTFFATQKAVKIQRKSNETNKTVGSYIVDRLLNYETLQCLVINKSYEINRCDDVLKNREDAMTHQSIVMNLIGIGQAIIIGTGITIITFVAAKGVFLGHELNISDYVLISAYLIQFADPLNMFGFIFKEMRQGLTTLENVMEILNETPEIIDKPEAKAFIPRKGDVAFEHVSFAYEGGNKILNDLSFTIPAGETVALVGQTGCGKSTISRLLFRFYDSTEGDIKIDGQNIKDCTLQSLRSSISVVPQEAVLFNGTIYFNVTYSVPNISQDEVDKVIKMVHLDKFIASLPDGYNTVVGERGLKLSGGEKQRIAIARALLKSPRLFIFDEATSALDTKTEQAIQTNLIEISSNITTLLIAHRLSTVTYVDKIIVLDEKANIVESGKHQELLANKGYYAQMWEYQSQNHS